MNVGACKRPLLQAITVALALCGVWASPASAASFGGTGESAYPLTITGPNVNGGHTFEVGTGERRAPFTCSTVNFESFIVARVTELTIEPTYSGCKFKNTAAEINMTGCRYVLKEWSPLFASKLDITCPSKAHIDLVVTAFKVPICTITVFPIANSLGHQYVNIAGPPKKVQDAVSIPSLEYEFDQNVANGCGGEKVNERMGGATYKGEVLFSGEDESGKAEDIEVS